jgi:ribokinase
MRQGHVVVVGSANYDRITYVDTLPAPGETVTARDMRESIGGKGVNQSIAAAALGARVLFLTALGDDPEGATIERQLQERGVELLSLAQSNLRTGTASVTVDLQGENSIVVWPGANADHTPSATARALDRAAEWATPRTVLVSQAEVPVDTIAQTAAAAGRLGLRFVLNIAPFVVLPADVLAAADPLVLNRTEAVALLRASGQDLDAAVAPEDLCRLISPYARTVVVTLGEYGAACLADGHYELCAPPKVDRVVDATGAGDAFVGAMAAALAQGMGLLAGVRIATHLSALTVSERGAASSYAVWTDQVLESVLVPPLRGLDGP